MTSRKRRAEEPASSPRSYKQPRLSPHRRNASLSQPPATKFVMYISRGEHLFSPVELKLILPTSLQ